MIYIFLSILLIMLIFLYVKNLLFNFDYKIFEFFYFLIISIIINLSIFFIFDKISLKSYIFKIFNNEFNQLLLFFFLIIIINIVIWFLISSKISTKIYSQILIALIYLIFYTHSIFILWFIWTEINHDEFLRNLYLLFLFILLNILLQLFMVWNITYIEIIFPEVKYMKSYVMLIYTLITLMFLWDYLKNKIIILFNILFILSIIIYYILENNIDIQIYNLIYIPYFSADIQIYIKIILIFIYVLISIKLSLNIYDKMYDKLDLNEMYIKISWYKKKNFKVFLIILFLTMLSLIILFYFIGNFLYSTLTLYNFGLILDFLTYIFFILWKIFIYTLKYTWIIIKLILALWYVIYYDLIIYNLN